MRKEHDSIGSMAVPEEAYYGVQSLRAKHNFCITGDGLHPAFIRSLAEIKKAAARSNREAGVISLEVAEAIEKACNEVIEGGLQDEFIVDAIQGGAGTSANMNINEVIANRASEILGGKKGEYLLVHPNDHVNAGQSTNDVIPTAGKLTVLKLLPELHKSYESLHKALLQKAIAFDSVIKMGRTQLQDAVPVRLGQEFKAYASVVARDMKRLEKVAAEMRVINMGATAVGTCINATPIYLNTIAENLSRITGEHLEQAEDLMDATQNVDSFVMVSGTVKTAAVSLSKICNDLRLLSSGPKTGIGEINLPAKQNGSSIMPGKINPVIPEVVSQVAFRIIGNDMAITMAAEAGQLELNAFEPVIFYNLFSNIETLKNAIDTLVENCIKGITANEAHCKALVEKSAGLATALCPYLGYEKSADLAKEALKTGKTVRSLVLEKNLLDAATLEHVLSPYEMTEVSDAKVS